MAWLRKHPGVKIISRDRSHEYAYAITTTAPEAAQVADRWHLLKNLREALEKLLIHKLGVLRSVANGEVATTGPLAGGEVAHDERLIEAIEAPVVIE